MEKIFYKGILIGIRITRLAAGAHPITGDKEPLQILTHKHLNGKHVVAHFHVPRPRRTKELQECLIVRKGKVRIDLYGPDGKYFKRLYLSKGQLFLRLHGGYAVHFSKSSEVFEIKNGPFLKDEVAIKSRI